MTRSADELVTEFCKKWATPDPEELAELLHRRRRLPQHSDGPRARAAKRSRSSSPVSPPAFDGIDFQVHRQVSDGNLVMNERTDVMRRKDGEPRSSCP